MAETPPPPRSIRPQPGPQENWLSSSADIAIYGGSAGGGKSWALLFEPLRHAANPGFGGVIFRRTSPQITNEGGLWDESLKLYPLAGARPQLGSLDWRFPSGANIGFRHMQHETDKLTWQGSQICFIGFDELTHFSESQFFYMFSRNRSNCGVRPYIRATTNPDAGSWVKKFLAPWVDRKHPDPAASGEVRWFVRVDGDLRWAHAREELVERYPKLLPKSVTFIRASIYDNKILMAKDPGYLANLMALPAVEQARLLGGDWDIVREGLVYPGFGACVVGPKDWPEGLVGEPLGGIDFGFNNPFAAPSGVLDRDDVLWIDALRYKREETLPEHEKALPRGVTWWADPARPDNIAELRVAGHAVRSCVHLGPRPLLTGIDRVTERIRTGRLKIASACGDLIGEAERHRYDEAKSKEEPIDKDNHALDALRYLIVGIDRGRVVDRRETAGQEEARQAAEDLAAAEAAAIDHERHMQADNPYWWSDDD